MRIAENWKTYRILDTSATNSDSTKVGIGEKLEIWGNISLIRPDPQIIWKTTKSHELWTNPDGHYHRSNSGGGQWEYYKKIPEFWRINYGELTFIVRPTSFKHLGLFPEQAVNWDFMKNKISQACIKSFCLYGRCNACMC